MKIFRYLIYALILVIFISLVILIVQPERSALLKPDWVNTEQNNIAQTTNTEIEDSEQQDDTIEILISETDVSGFPPFILAMPQNPTGIDRNGNGLRDDLEVYIGYRFPFKPQVRAILIQMVNIVDRMAKAKGKSKASRLLALYQEERMAKECWYKNGIGEDDLNALKSLVLNNKQRKKGYEATMDAWKGIEPELINALKMPEQPCDIMIMENQMTLQEWVPSD